MKTEIGKMSDNMHMMRHCIYFYEPSTIQAACNAETYSFFFVFTLKQQYDYIHIHSQKKWCTDVDLTYRLRFILQYRQGIAKVI